MDMHCAGENDAAARQLALLLQGRASELFGVDIHPGASIGGATFIDTSATCGARRWPKRVDGAT